MVILDLKCEPSGNDIQPQLNWFWANSIQFMKNKVLRIEPNRTELGPAGSEKIAVQYKFKLPDPPKHYALEGRTPCYSDLPASTRETVFLTFC